MTTNTTSTPRVFIKEMVMKSKDANDSTEQALLDELNALDEHLKSKVCFFFSK
ncbi:putative glutathione dehydrogenase (ascorbate) [Helianthus annuus]|nr:putative glutathione dehydrogenase (ascorbate) [Helianthus annuus]